MTHAELLYALAAAGANVAGALAVVVGARWSVKAVDSLLSFAAGFLICVSVVDLFPESLERLGERGAVAALVAYVLVHLTQHTLGRHFHFGEETHKVSSIVSMSALIGLTMHTFVDGVAVASGVDVSAAVGALVFVGVLLHKLPEGLAISSLFLAAGASRAKAVGAAALLGATTIVGALLADNLEVLRTYGLPISAGVSLYVAASNLVPEFQSKEGWRHPVAFVVGCATYFAARAVMGG